MIGKRLLAVSILLIVTMFIGVSSAEADTKAEELIAKLQAKSGTINSYRADLTMTMDMMGQKMISTGKMAFKEPNKSWMELNTKMGGMEMNQITVSDGKTTWTHQPQMNMVQKIDIERVMAETGNDMTRQQGGGNLSNPLEGFERESISYIRKDKVEGEGVYVFQGTPKGVQTKNMPFTIGKMELWISTKNGMPRKVIIFNKEDKEIMSQTYSNIEVNIEIPDSQFEFTPPEGVQITDMTEGTINMMKQMNQEAE
jgi:outer membrane lipoprotein-sorting protein